MGTVCPVKSIKAPKLFVVDRFKGDSSVLLMFIPVSVVSTIYLGLFGPIMVAEWPPFWKELLTRLTLYSPCLCLFAIVVFSIVVSMTGFWVIRLFSRNGLNSMESQHFGLSCSCPSPKSCITSQKPRVKWLICSGEEFYLPRDLYRT